MQTARVWRRWEAAGTALALRRAAAVSLLLLIGLASGLAAARYGLLVSLGTLAGLAVAVFAFFRPWDGFLVAVAIALLLPFGVLPVSLGLTPSFLELALLGFLAGWLLSPLLGGRWRGRFSLLDALAWTFFGLTLVSLIRGRGVTPTLLHNYGKLALGMLAFFGVRHLSPTRAHLRQFLRLFFLAAGLAALLGLGLQALPDALARDFLVGLGPLGYPTQGRVLRYVEDNPGGLERAIGTSVDPNSFGGMLAVAAAMAFPPLAAKRTWMVRMALLLAGLYLTYSRAALGGFLAAAVFLAAARYRRLWWFLLAGVLLLALLLLVGGGPALERLRQGILFQDLANRMRLAEFANALAILGRYPVWGVGLGSAPDVDLSTGVSSLYLTVAERMGLVGLGSFLALVGVALVRGLRLARREEERLPLLAGVVAALSTGLLDHYFFNPEFPHMAFLLWGLLGLATAEVPPEDRGRTGDGPDPAEKSR
ncbi:MAG: O-antigen ligase family protein [Chloroflexia bacterium]